MATQAAATSLFEALADSAPDAIVTIDADSTIVSANKAVERVFGYEPSELVGTSLLVLMPDSLRARHRLGFKRYLQSGQKHIPWTGVQLVGLTKDGREIPIEISFGEFIDPRGRRVFSGFIRDITDRVRVQRELETAQTDLHLHAALLASIEHAVISTDTRGTVLTWNQYAE